MGQCMRVGRGEADLGVDIAQSEFLASFKTPIERAQYCCRAFAQLRRALDGNQIAALGEPDAELLLQAHKIAAVAAGQRGQQRIALEFQRDLLARTDIRSGAVARVQCATALFAAGALPSASAPLREFGRTSMIFTLRSSPINGAAPSTCTGCR